MKQLRLLVSVFCAFSCLVLPPQGKPSVAVPLAVPEWVNAAGQSYNGTNANVSQNSGSSAHSSLQLDSSGNPCVAWTDYTPGNSDIFFARWSGSSWVNASGATLTATNGNVSNNLRDSYYPSLAHFCMFGFYVSDVEEKNLEAFCPCMPPALFPIKSGGVA